MKTILNIAKAVGLVGVLALSSAASAADSGTAYLKNFMQNVRTLDASFTQEILNSRGKLTTSFGRFQLQRPGKFRWEYKGNMPQVIVADGNKLYVHDVELEQVTVKPLNKALGSSPAGILMHRKNLDQDFTITEAASKDGLKWVQLIPKRRGGDFQKILIGLDDAGVQAMDLHDQFGQITMIRFQESNFNTSLPGSAFQFTPPPGADVING